MSDQDKLAVGPVAIETHGPVATANLLFRRKGELRLAVIAKTTFSYDDRGRMMPDSPRSIFEADQHAGADVTQSVVAPRDTFPFQHAAELLFVGSAYTLTGPRPHRRVRMALERDGKTLLEKQLDVYGDRTSVPGGPASDPAPFVKMPITYERAVGSSQHRDNPLGVGLKPDRSGRLTLPNLYYAGGARPDAVACFGPIAAFWPSRVDRIRAHRKALQGKPMDLPDDFDDDFFQSAPEDQRLAYLEETDVIELEGLHPRKELLRLRMPPVALKVFATLRDASAPLELRPDVVLVEGDAQRCTVTSRGSLLLPNEEALSEVRIKLRLTVGQQQRRVPNREDGDATIARSHGYIPRAAPPPPPRRGVAKTLPVDALPAAAMPFAPGSAAAAPPPDGDDFDDQAGETMLANPELQALVNAHAPTPFAAGAAPPAAGLAPTPPAPAQTLNVGELVAATEHAPFPLSHAGAVPATHAVVAGAPWSAEPAAPTVPPAPAQESTVRLPSYLDAGAFAASPGAPAAGPARPRARPRQAPPPPPAMPVAGATPHAPAAPAPAVQAPAVRAPAVQAPAVQAPAVQAPAVQAPAVQAPVVQAPVAPPAQAATQPHAAPVLPWSAGPEVGPVAREPQPARRPAANVKKLLYGDD